MIPKYVEMSDSFQVMSKGYTNEATTIWATRDGKRSVFHTVLSFSTDGQIRNSVPGLFLGQSVATPVLNVQKRSGTSTQFT